MIPYPSAALSMLSGRLMDQLLPDLKSAYFMSDGMLVALLMNALADELESGIETRLQDIKEMQVIFAGALQKFERPELPGEIEALSEATPVNMSLTTVNDLHDRMTRALIELHELAEGRLTNEGARALNDEIWAYLARNAERHQITAAG